MGLKRMDNVGIVVEDLGATNKAEGFRAAMKELAWSSILSGVGNCYEMSAIAFCARITWLVGQEKVMSV